MKETKHCPYCGEEILAAAKKCRYCGAWQKEKPAPKEMIACPICGERIDRKGTEICPHCNERVYVDDGRLNLNVYAGRMERNGFHHQT